MNITLQTLKTKSGDKFTALQDFDETLILLRKNSTNYVPPMCAAEPEFDSMEDLLKDLKEKGLLDKFKKVELYNRINSNIRDTEVVEIPMDLVKQCVEG